MVTPDPLDQEQQRAFRELDQTRRTTYPDNCVCRTEDAITTQLDLEDIE